MSIFTSMRILTHAAWPLCLAVLLSAALHTCTPNTEHELAGPEKEGKSAGLGPNDYFMLDRNYPNATVSTEAYQRLLRESMAYDKHQQAEGRDLNFPWQLEGPGNIGGRVNAVAVHPENENIILLGYSQGGIWRTENGGEEWIPVFDEHPGLSIAHIIFDPHDATHLWAATGDVNISGYYWLGTGVYESVDGGLSWHNKGLSDVGILSKVVVDPNDPDILYVGSLGFPAEKSNDRGLFRSIDGGNNWLKALTIDDSTGIVDIVADPTTPGRVFASSYTRIRSNVIGRTTGPGTGLYRSDDYGATWSNVTTGLPSGMHSRTGVEMTNDGTLFLSYVGDRLDDPDCGSFTEDVRAIYKSSDGGMTWDSISLDPSGGWQCVVVGGFGWYFEYLKVNPENPQDIFILGVGSYRTLDGGATWFNATPEWESDVHADKHDLVFAHGNVYLGTDGGAYKRDIDFVNVWEDIEYIPSTQYYRTEWNPHTPDLYYGGAQDNGTSGGNASLFNDWTRLWGGDGFQMRFDPTEPDWRYVLTQYGNVWFSEDGGFDFNWLGTGLTGTRYWDMPLVMDAFNPKILYCGAERVYKINMDDALREWTPISGDLTRGEEILSGRYPALTAFAQSPLDSLRLYAGTQDGLIWTSPDGGVTWIDITDGTPGFFVTSITPSTVDSLAVFATYSGYRDNNHSPYVYQSADAGINWSPIQTDLPMMGVNDLFIVPETEDKTILVATDGGVYASIDGSVTWHRVGNNMPYMPVYDIDFNPVENRIIAATFSRGIMTFPVEELFIETTSTSDDFNADKINVYPTVFESLLTLNIETSNDAGLRFALISTSGVTVYHEMLNKRSNGNHTIAIPNSVSPGAYLVSITGKEKMYAARRVVKL
jgi:photosystem II stability/assembly factor-like uncharacterized protein